MSAQRRFLARSKIAAATALALAVVALPVAGGSAAGCWTPKAAERGFTKAINADRAAKDRVKIKLDPELSKVARAHTRKMIRGNELHHSTKLEKRVTNWELLGENVGVGGSVDSLHGAFMDSKGHRLNILYRAYRYVGIGVKVDDSGRMWVTVVFQATKNPGTTLRMPAAC